MELDEEMKEEFLSEVRSLQLELKTIVDKLLLNYKQPPLFLEFGQKIDRIYGTAMTLGLNDFGLYAKAMKDVCYMCGNANSDMGQKKVLNMMSTCLENFDILCRGIGDPKAFKEVANVIKSSIQKVEILEKTYFSHVKDKKSVAK